VANVAVETIQVFPSWLAILSKTLALFGLGQLVKWKRPQVSGSFVVAHAL